MIFDQLFPTNFIFAFPRIRAAERELRSESGAGNSRVNSVVPEREVEKYAKGKPADLKNINLKYRKTR